MKSFSIYLLALIVFFSLNSCYDDDSLIVDSIEQSSVNDLYSKGNSNIGHVYEFNENGDLIEHFDNEKSLILTLSEDNSQITQNFQDGVLTLTNLKTGEYIEVTKIDQKDKLITFDATTSSGINLNGLSFINNSGSNDKWWVPIVGRIVREVFELLDATSLEQCTEAMGELNCAPGSSPFMEFKDSWFSTSCTVGCRN